jgi:hypothetical protein
MSHRPDQFPGPLGDSAGAGSGNPGHNEMVGASFRAGFNLLPALYCVFFGADGQWNGPHSAITIRSNGMCKSCERSTTSLYRLGDCGSVSRALLWSAYAIRRVDPAVVVWICLCANRIISLKAVAQLVDRNLNLKPVSKLKLIIREVSSTRNQPVSTGFDGTAELNVPCGTYMVVSDGSTEFEGKRFRWELKVTLTAGVPYKLELSNDTPRSTQHRRRSLRSRPRQHQAESRTAWQCSSRNTKAVW